MLIWCDAFGDGKRDYFPDGARECRIECRSEGTRDYCNDGKLEIIGGGLVVSPASSAT